ncbi:hypothetical protein LXM24_08215 [Dyadobacter sp. CY399]|uniref:Uncharacterized protein n=2 Tax=Dyadobacter fanqingshengii TaxID=2906443 RepID=A0A9X1P7B5_9BACT|nr:hypothetical protein [Dyadobacter fanqingshengii]MCF0040066.1 hypothetical protein [Dyadobacter fanqingshengii]
MERLDILNFKKHAINGEYVFVTEDKMKIRQWRSSPESIIQESALVNSTETLYHEFDSQSGQIKITGKRFYGFPVGEWKQFSKDGSLLKSWNEDRNYDFNVEQLVAKVKELGFNLKISSPGVWVSRTRNGLPFYYVTYPVSAKSPYVVYKVKIDGKTGKILSQEEIKTRN